MLYMLPYVMLSYATICYNMLILRYISICYNRLVCYDIDDLEEIVWTEGTYSSR